MRQKERFDIIICGAGPAGLTCALALGRSGLKVALVEKHSFPKDKICGDAIAAYVPKVLNTIDPEYARAFLDFAEKEKVNIVRIFAPDQNKLDLNFHEFGFICERLKFDDFLFRLVKKLPNVKFFANTTLNNVEINEKGVTARIGEDQVLESELIIGCDGANGVVAKKLTPTKMDPKHHSGAVRTYYKNVSGIQPHTFELHLLKGIVPGYFWIFPLPGNRCNVGLGLTTQKISADKLNLKTKMTELIEELPYLSERFKNAERMSEMKGFGLPLGSRKVTMSGNRFMLCGDAASLIDPLTGEGIGQAMVSGRYAGWHAMACFKKNDFSAEHMQEYNNLVYAKLWKDNRRRYLIKKLISGRPQLVNSMVSLANKSQFLRKTIEKVM